MLVNIGEEGMDSLEIGPAPKDEPRQRPDLPGYNALTARNDCLRFIEAIRKTVGQEPYGAALVVKPTAVPFKNQTSYSVYVRYDESYPDAVQYALKCELSAPNKYPEE